MQLLVEDHLTGTRSPQVSLKLKPRFSLRQLPVQLIGFLLISLSSLPLIGEDNEETHGSSRKPIEKMVENWFLTMSAEAGRGYKHLVETPYLPPDFDDDVARRLAAQTWNQSTGQANSSDHQANDSDLAQAFWQRFGLSERPPATAGSDKSTSTESNEGKSLLPAPLQYIVNRDGSYVMNCFACHGGKVNGVSYPGAPNNSYALQTLTEEVRSAKLQMGKPLSHMDVGSAFLPLGTTRGSSNAVMFGVALMHFRDADLNVISWRPAPKLVNHDMDPPPWWHFKKKHHIYIDGFAQKGHRGLMQFMLVRQNGPDKFRNWESDFRDVYEFINSIPSPKYPGNIDDGLAQQGEVIFNDNCSSCHGTYGPQGKYPELMVPLEEIGTDPVRHKALTAAHRQAYGESWFAEYGKQSTITEPEGYVAPPLDGVWATAPYLHNGSVPTLWHLLNPENRPVVWRRVAEQQDDKRMGLQVEELQEVPKRLPAEKRREYFDTRVPGKNAAGHDFPSRLTEQQKTAVLEYLKTL